MIAAVLAGVAVDPSGAAVPGRPTARVQGPTSITTVPINASGIASDDVGVVEVEVGLWSVALGGYYVAAGQATPTVLAAIDVPGGMSISWTYTFTEAPDGEYRLYARSRDADGAVSSWSIRSLEIGTVPGAPALCGGLAVTVDLAQGQSPTAGNDVVLGTAGDDVIDALGGDDTVCGLDGNDTIIGGAGTDSLYGGPGNDSVQGDGDADQLFGDSGDDALDGGAGTDICTPGNTGENAGDAAPIDCESIDDGSMFEWNPQEIGSGGWVTGMASHPTQANLHIARTDVGGAYRWNQAGQTWDQLLDASTVEDPQQQDWNVSSVAIAESDPDRIYMATGRRFDVAEGRILRSDDGGDTWLDTGARLPIHANAKHRTGGERLAVDPTNPDHLWFGSRTLGLLESFDAGATFAPVAGVPVGVNSGDPAGVKWVLADQQGADLVLYAGVAGEGVYTATNAGPWTQVYAETTIPYDAEVAADGRLFVVSLKSPGRVMRYDPASGVVDDITPVPQDREFITIGIDPFDANRILVGSSGLGDGRIWRSLDGGDTWTDLDRDAECSQIPWLDLYDADNDFFSASSFTFDPTVQGLLWLPEGFAMRQTTDLSDSEITFSCQSDGIEELVANDVIVTPGGSVITASWDRPIFVHEDGQAAVQQPSTRFNSAWDLDWSPADSDFAVAVIGDHRFLNGDGVAYDSVYTLDGGDSWARFGSFDTATHPADLRFGNVAASASDTSNLVRLPTFNKAVHVTADRGDTWTEIILPGTEGVVGPNDNAYAGGSHFSYFLNRKVLAADRVLGGTFYVLHEPLGLFRSDDGGATWVLQPTTGLPQGISSFNAQLEAVPGDAEHLFFTPGTLNGTTTDFYETRDGGATWRTVAGVNDVTAFGFGAPKFAGGPASIYFNGQFDGARGIFESIDDTASWSLVVDYPLGIYQTLKTISGDQTEYGRIYVGWSGVSFAEATLFAPADPPAAPGSVDAVLVGSDAVVSWSEPASDEPILEYVVEIENVTDGETTTSSAGTALELTFPLEAGTTYRFRVRAVSVAGEGPFSASSPDVTGPPVISDETDPVLVVVSPVDDEVVALVSVSGLVSDDVSGVDRVEVGLRSPDDGWFRPVGVNSNKFDVDVDVPGALATTFSYDFVGAPAGEYVLSVRAYDVEGNRGSWTRVRITVGDGGPVPDETDPVLVVVSPVDDEVVALVSVSGLVSDDVSGVDRVEVGLRSPDDGWFRPVGVNSNKFDVDVDVPGALATTFSYDFVGAPAGEYVLSVRAYDVEGNRGSWTRLGVTIE